MTLVLGTQAWQNSCKSWSCRKSIDLCYIPRCGLLNYCLNGDIFAYFFQDYTPFLNIDLTHYQNELNELDEDNLDSYPFFGHELTDLDESLRSKKEIMREERAKRLARYANIKKDFQNNLREKRNQLTAETKQFRKENKDKRDARKQKWDNLKQIQKAKREALNQKWIEKKHINKLKWTQYNKDGSELAHDPSSLRDLLNNHRDDSFRSALLYPSSCPRSCKDSYTGLYSIWGSIMSKLHSVYKSKFANLNCASKRRDMRKWFNHLCRPYSEVISLPLHNYYDYLVDSHICDGW